MASESSCACSASPQKAAHEHHHGHDHDHGHEHAHGEHAHHDHAQHAHHDHVHGHGHAHGHGHGHGHAHGHGHGHGHGGHDHVHADISLSRLVAAIVLALSAELLHLTTWPLAHDAGLALAVLAIALSGSFTYTQGLKALVKGRLSMDALMAIAVTGAFAIGQWPEAAMVMALFVLAEHLEERASERANAAVARLLALAPQTAHVRGSDGAWQRMAVDAVQLGARLRVAPGERVALDGRIVLGHGALDEAALTGESLPVDKGPGDTVHAGSVNQSAELEIEVTAIQANSLLARIAAAVAAAQAQRAPVQRLVDRFAAVYTPAVAALALAVAVLTPLLLGWSWHEGVYRALVLLVIACPCALLLSTPVTLVSALTSAARRGVLIKGGAFLEQAAGLRAIALDKTGTLTEGRPRLVAFEVLAGEAAELRSLARSLALRSDHPLSRAIAAGLEGPAHDVVDFQAHPGCGVEGQIGERRLLLANPRWLAQKGLRDNALDERLQPHEKAGHSLVLLADGERVLALCALADTIKPGAAAAVAELKALGLTPVMLTGDHAASARTVAAAVGISEVHAQLLPEAKLAAVTLLQSRHGATAMVGDGINDAPALARAELGIAMGGIGSDIAMEAADIVVMNDELGRLPETIRLARRCKRVLMQNMSLALGIKLAFLAMAVFGLSSLWMAVFADVGASLLVIANGLRMLRGPSLADNSMAKHEHPTGTAHAHSHPHPHSHSHSHSQSHPHPHSH